MIVIWEAPALVAAANPKMPTDAERDAWWTALGGHAKEAHQAMGAMVASPDVAVALFKEKAAPIPASDKAVVARLIAGLDAEEFVDREKAAAALDRHGEAAADLIRQALEEDISTETRRRLQKTLRKIEDRTPESLRRMRAVAALEWIGTPAARELLRAQAAGAPAARLTKEANAALKRMGE
jgi:hypothetical protein